ncbi:hypothetical protein AQUCO_138400001v1, partial [Aquilegia coerulea]
DNTTKAMFWTMDVTLGLLEMGFSEDEVSSAIEKFGAEIPIEELADSIFAQRMAGSCFETNEPPALHRKNHSHGETEASSSKAFRPAKEMHTSGIPKGKKLKLDDDYSHAFLGTYNPETNPFEPKSPGVPMSFPSKELPKVAKGSLDDGVKIPHTTHAMPHTKEWWPSWDTRKQLSSINPESQGIYQVCEKLGKMLIDERGVISVGQQTEILNQCKRLNLMWVGHYKLTAIEPEQVERILGYPVCHTQSGGLDRGERLKLLNHSFQIDTVGYHLSPLKSLFPDGLSILSLHSGIGGAEIAIHNLGLRLKSVVSVELSETNQRILRTWWENTKQGGKLVQIKDISKLTSVKLQSLMDELGGFDLIICQGPYTPSTSKAALDPENPAAFDFRVFFEFFRVLEIVRNTMPSKCQC